MWSRLEEREGRESSETLKYCSRMEGRARERHLGRLRDEMWEYKRELCSKKFPEHGLSELP